MVHTTPTSHGTLAVQVAAILCVALVLTASGAHLFSLLSKMRLSPPDYMIAQRAYDGWALFGLPILAALILTLWHSYLVRADPAAMRLSLLAFLCLVAMQAIFWIYTYPMNVASRNWTVLPDEFEVARSQWEYSHAVGAILNFVALAAITASTLVSRQPPPPAT